MTTNVERTAAWADWRDDGDRAVVVGAGPALNHADHRTLPHIGLPMVATGSPGAAAGRYGAVIGVGSVSPTVTSGGGIPLMMSEIGGTSIGTPPEPPTGVSRASVDEADARADRSFALNMDY